MTLYNPIPVYTAPYDPIQPPYQFTQGYKTLYSPIPDDAALY